MVAEIRKLYLVTRRAMRPASEKKECFYCQQPIGAEHERDCVLIHKKVTLRMTVEFDVEVPNHWDKEAIEFHRNDGTYCVDNDLRKLQKLSKTLGCLCSITKYEYVGDVGEEYLDER